MTEPKHTPERVVLDPAGMIEWHYPPPDGSDTTKTRMFYDGGTQYFDSKELADAAYWALPKGTLMAFRCAGETRPVSSSADFKTKTTPPMILISSVEKQIAAAPDLLEACKDMAPYLRTLAAMLDIVPENLTKTQKSAMAAIAKAERNG